MIALLSRATVAGACLAMALPAVAAAHALGERYQAPLPLIAYVAGAALAVAMSFAFVMLRASRAGAPAAAEQRGQHAATAAERSDEDERRVPRWLRLTLGAIGLIGWAWIIAQGVLGGADPLADVGYLFLWVYGWIGVALISAFVGPVWAWLDPFSTIHGLVSAVGRRLGMLGSHEQDRPFPARLGIWPAVIGFLIVVWLELVAFVTGGRTLAMLLLAYTLFTLAGMSWFGRQAWRAHGEVFGVWFGLLGRLAPFSLVGQPEDGRVRRRGFAVSMLHAQWDVAAVVLVALATGAIIYDGLSQTRLYFDLFGTLDLPGLPPVALHTVVMLGFLGLVVGLVLWVGQLIGMRAIGAGLLPVAVGYLIAHYLVALLVDGQAIVRAINDPLLRGDDLLPFPLSAYEPALFVPVSLVWSLQLAAVVGGHVVGAWAGHGVIERTHSRRLARELPLAVLMVALTSVTLWSLGQEVIVEEAAARSAPAVAGAVAAPEPLAPASPAASPPRR